MRRTLLWLVSLAMAGAIAAQNTGSPPKLIDFATFSAEAVDREWSQGMETRILDELAQVKGSEIFALQAQCRTSLCRVQLTTRVSPQPGVGIAFSILREPLAKVGLVCVQMSTSAPQGGMETSVAYLRRELSP